jgi:hypothetical protein
MLARKTVAGVADCCCRGWRIGPAPRPPSAAEFSQRILEIARDVPDLATKLSTGWSKLERDGWSIVGAFPRAPDSELSGPRSGINRRISTGPATAPSICSAPREASRLLAYSRAVEDVTSG